MKTQHRNVMRKLEKIGYEKHNKKREKLSLHRGKTKQI